MVKNTAMTGEEKEALETAIRIYVEMGVLNRVCRSTDSFLSRVPGISALRLQGLIKNHSQEIAAMAGAKGLIYQAGSYRASGRGAFGRKSGGDRAITVKPSIEFIL